MWCSTRLSAPLRSGSARRSLQAPFLTARRIPARLLSAATIRRQQQQDTTDPITGIRKSEEKEKPYYVTSPIFYVNAAPHVGHMYTMLLVDVVKRWEELKGRKALLVTGTDEHGMKIQQAAQLAQKDPREFCDTGAAMFQDLAARVNCNYDTFIRTTDPKHYDAVQYFWQMLQSRDLIYTDKHNGWYSVADETFYPEGAIESIVEPSTGRKIKVSKESGREVQWTSEVNYHFRLSAMAPKLLEFYKQNPDWIVPSSRYKDVIATVEAGLEDLSISRSRSRLTWGIPVPNDPEQTVYVWLDALVNYLTASGYPWAPGKEQELGWPADLHVIGKDIVKFHCVYWPAFLLALDLPMPKQILTHAHWTMNHKKMSKSDGNVVNPFYAIDRFGTDPMRYYLARDGGIKDDGDYSNEMILKRYRSELQKGFGNLAGRVRGKSFDVAASVKAAMSGGMTGDWVFDTEDVAMVKALDSFPRDVYTRMENLDIPGGLRGIVDLMNETNRYLQNTAPWSIDKAKNPTELQRRIYFAAEAIRICAILLQPFMPEKAKMMLDNLSVDPQRRTMDHAVIAMDDTYGARVNKATQPFPPLPELVEEGDYVLPASKKKPKNIDPFAQLLGTKVQMEYNTGGEIFAVRTPMIPKKPLPQKYRINRPVSSAENAPNVRQVWVTPTPGQSRKYHTSVVITSVIPRMLHAATFATFAARARQKPYVSMEDEDPEFAESIADAEEARALARQTVLDDAEELYETGWEESFPPEDLEAKRELRRQRRRERKQNILEIKEERKILRARWKMQKIQAQQQHGIIKFPSWAKGEEVEENTPPPATEGEEQGDQDPPMKVLWGSAKMTKRMEGRLLKLKQYKEYLEEQQENRKVLKKQEEEEDLVNEMKDPLAPKKPARFPEPRNLMKPTIRFHWGNYGPDEVPEETNVWRSPTSFPEADQPAKQEAELREAVAAPEEVKAKEDGVASEFDINYDPELEAELDAELDAEIAALEAEEAEEDFDFEPEMDMSPESEARSQSSGIMWEVPRISRREIIRRPVEEEKPVPSPSREKMKTVAAEPVSRPPQVSKSGSERPAPSVEPVTAPKTTTYVPLHLREESKSTPPSSTTPPATPPKPATSQNEVQSRPPKSSSAITALSSSPAQASGATKYVPFHLREAPQPSENPRHLLEPEPVNTPEEPGVKVVRTRTQNSEWIPNIPLATKENPFAAHIRNRPEWYTIWPRHTRYAFEILALWKGDYLPSDPKSHLLPIMLAITKELASRGLCRFRHSSTPFEKIEPWVDPPPATVTLNHKTRRALKQGSVLEVMTPDETGDLWKSITLNPPSRDSFPSPFSDVPLPIRTPTPEESRYAAYLVKKWVNEDLIPVRVTALLDEFQYRYGYRWLKSAQFFTPEAFKKTATPTKKEINEMKPLYVEGMSGNEYKAEKTRVQVERSMMKLHEYENDKQKVMVIRKMKRLYDEHSKKVPIVKENHVPGWKR